MTSELILLIDEESPITPYFFCFTDIPKEPR
jgi:hypothetical protein